MELSAYQRNMAAARAHGWPAHRQSGKRQRAGSEGRPDWPVVHRTTVRLATGKKTLDTRCGIGIERLFTRRRAGAADAGTGARPAAQGEFVGQSGHHSIKGQSCPSHAEFQRAVKGFRARQL